MSCQLHLKSPEKRGAVDETRLGAKPGWGERENVSLGPISPSLANCETRVRLVWNIGA